MRMRKKEEDIEQILSIIRCSKRKIGIKLEIEHKRKGLVDQAVGIIGRIKNQKLNPK